MTSPTLTAERLREVLAYCPDTGRFTWRVSGRGRFKRAGNAAGTVNGHGYVAITIDGQVYAAHRLAWLHVHGRWPEFEIDHRNGHRADNRIANLRDVPTAVNRQNLRAARRDSSTGVLGVSMRGGSPIASIQVNGRQRHLGVFSTVAAAGEAYVAAKRAMHEGCTL